MKETTVGEGNSQDNNHLEREEGPDYSCLVGHEFLFYSKYKRKLRSCTDRRK